MKWSSEPPKEPGWYFGGTPKITGVKGSMPQVGIHWRVYHIYRKKIRLFIEGHGIWTEELSKAIKRHSIIRWAGPILEPEEMEEMDGQGSRN